MNKNLTLLEKKIKIKFKNKELLEQALTHRSYLNEHGQKQLTHNERLEFLGDAVLELIVTEYLYRKYQESEGVLTCWRASLVNTNMLANVAEEISLDKYLYLSEGEKLSLKRTKLTILADAFEALIGAIYLDRGLAEVKKFIEGFVIEKLPQVFKLRLYEDPKSRLQEILQAKHKMTPVYRLIKEEGPDHAKKFTLGVYLGDKKLAIGMGASKQEASEQAAAEALKKQRKTKKIK
jgi:ribonuclease III